MSKESDRARLEEQHRRFAVEQNNRAWDLAARDRTREEDRELLDAAHASALHWSAIGTELNRMRSFMLLAHVHASLGHGQTALAYADDMHRYFLGRDTPDWETALAHIILAHAAHSAGDMETHAEALAAARQALEKIADPEDRQIVMETFERVPTA